ncbi:polyprenol monophosphomannose synthase [Chloroflexi bacterium]|nr:polyprenol monophosphomannose synthase [Chloroflexota bacterium]
MKFKQVPIYIVIPTYNESESINILLGEIFNLGLANTHVLIVDDDSPDGTSEIAEIFAENNKYSVAFLRRNAKEGLGTAYKDGFQEILRRICGKEAFVVQMDADLSHNPAYLPEMISMLRENDVVVGSRYYLDGGAVKKWSLYRKILSSGANRLIRLMSGLAVNDCTSGFKIFRSKVLKNIAWDDIRCVGFGFQIEVAMECQIKGFTVKECPIIFNARMSGYSKMSMSIIFEAVLKVTLKRLKVFKLIGRIKGHW